jgi:hypothetical protein
MSDKEESRKEARGEMKRKLFGNVDLSKYDVVQKRVCIQLQLYNSFPTWSPVSESEESEDDDAALMELFRDADKDYSGKDF